jgi:hypothetical protein
MVFSHDGLFIVWTPLLTAIRRFGGREHFAVIVAKTTQRLRPMCALRGKADIGVHPQIVRSSLKAGSAFWHGHLLFKPSPQSNTNRKSA